MASDEENVRRLVEALRDFDDAMLVTRMSDGALRARPMALAEVRDDGHVTFASERHTSKTDEIEGDPHVVVCLQKGDLYVSLTGTAAIHDDRARIEELWRDAWKPWFPQGKDDPDLCLIEIEPQSAELWDQRGGKGVKNFVAMATAAVRGEKVEHPEETHASVDLQR